MSWIDWCIVLIPLALVTGMAIYAKRYAESVVNFLAAGRVAGRYVLCVGDMVTAAVLATQNQYLTFEKKLIDAVYSSSDGGATEDSENVFG